MHGHARAVVTTASHVLGRLRRGSRLGLRILLYHSVGDERGADRFGAVSGADFEHHVRWLREDSGLRLVSLEDGVASLTAERWADTAISLTFDDGYLDTLTIAAPVLVRHGVPFTVFAVGGFLTRPPAPGRYLDASGLRELADVPGAAIGAHGHTHRPLTRLDDAGVEAELRDSVEAIASVTGMRPTVLSYPHGAMDRRVVAAAGRAGFRAGATSLIGVNRTARHVLRLRRTEILAGDSLAVVRGKVRGDWDWYQMKQRLYGPLPEMS
jgi:peptidoglycan/xylan/chitin deacetylase (PgdA/CDA1 family)